MIYGMIVLHINRSFFANYQPNLVTKEHSGDRFYENREFSSKNKLLLLHFINTRSPN